MIDLILRAYAQGIFPMADSRDDDETYWIEPEKRGIIPFDRFNIPKSLRQFMRKASYHVTYNEAFAEVLTACALTPRGDGKGTWINHKIESWFLELHANGHAHSVEVWNNENHLIGGLYGLAQGGCFNGESMFSLGKNASKIALVYLVERLRQQGFTLLDTQFVNDHLLQFGCVEIEREDYNNLLSGALKLDVHF